ncbi:aspartic proteinase CDR1-like [Vicia villosa]|uniref:aspartic proteinase CDR1-like n=1 Tax=Vicia villosa TaxID=3911 RepID=UPI00273C586B|nr:aspartic proteinase CDR1-like [Vicia villosa]
MSHISYFALIFFYIFCLNFISYAADNDFSIELIHRDSPKSPFYNPTQTKSQRVSNVVHRSIKRANYLNKQFSPNKNKIESSLTYDSFGEYLISYSVGTPPFKVYGILDTGSNLIWLQCTPCSICFNQTTPIFNPSKSLSYQNISCSSKTCKSMEDTSCSNNGDACEYTLEYQPGSKTQGELSVETLSLFSTSGSIISFPKIVMGCGHTNTWAFPYTGQISGVVGLGSGEMSLIKQLGSVIDGKFSYCLSVNEYYRKFNVSSRINFGDSAIVSGDNVVSTPIVKIVGNQEKDNYYLDLEAFSVGNKRIKYRGFRRKGINATTRSMIIDSGAIVTLLPRHFYNRLESAVKKVIKLERIHDDSYNLCYNTTSSQHSNFPELTAHFSGADVKLDFNGAFDTLDESTKCFAFRPNDYGLGIYGSGAQVNYLIGYDLKKNIISFKPTDCSKY